MLLLDANVLITSSRQYYPLELVPTFWKWLAEQFASGEVGLCTAVFQELQQGKDLLPEWTRKHAARIVMFDDAAQGSMVELINWTDGRQFTERAKEIFFNSADSELVATAAAGGHTVVTLEQPAPQSQKRVKVPDACDALQVPWITPWEMHQLLSLHI